jgi:hypothetical protein
MPSLTTKLKNMTTYTSTTIKVKGNTWSVVKASGRSKYFSIRKETNNPFKGLGKEFATEDEALQHYKSPAMKVALIQAFSQL